MASDNELGGPGQTISETSAPPFDFIAGKIFIVGI